MEVERDEFRTKTSEVIATDRYPPFVSYLTLYFCDSAVAVVLIFLIVLRRFCGTGVIEMISPVSRTPFAFVSPQSRSAVDGLLS